MAAAATDAAAAAAALAADTPHMGWVPLAAAAPLVPAPVHTCHDKAAAHTRPHTAAPADIAPAAVPVGVPVHIPHAAVLAVHIPQPLGRPLLLGQEVLHRRSYTPAAEAPGVALQRVGSAWGEVGMLDPAGWGALAPVWVLGSRSSCVGWLVLLLLPLPWSPAQCGDACQAPAEQKITNRFKQNGKRQDEVQRSSNTVFNSKTLLYPTARACFLCPTGRCGTTSVLCRQSFDRPLPTSYCPVQPLQPASPALQRTCCRSSRCSARVYA
jgi:hypothetical protein